MDETRQIRSEDVDKFLEQNPRAVKALRSAQRFLEGDPNSKDKQVRRNFYIRKLRMIDSLKRTREAAQEDARRRGWVFTVNDGRLDVLRREIESINSCGSESQRKDLDRAERFMEKKGGYASYNYGCLFVQSYQELLCDAAFLTGKVPTKHEVAQRVVKLSPDITSVEELGSDVTLSVIYKKLGFRDTLRGAKRGPKKRPRA
jgi:hypothetical protein